MPLPVAREILRHGPYLDLDGLQRVAGATPEILARFRSLATEPVKADPDPEDAAESLSMGGILRPYLRRFLLVWFRAALIGAIGFRLVRRASLARSGGVGLAAAALGLLIGWGIPGLPGVTSIAAVTILLGLPAGVRAWTVSRSPREGARALLGSIVAGLPAAWAVVPW